MLTELDRWDRQRPDESGNPSLFRYAKGICSLTQPPWLGILKINNGMAKIVTDAMWSESRADGAGFAVATPPNQEPVARDHLLRQAYRVLLPEISLKKRRRSR